MKPEKILAKAVQAAHLSGVHTLSQEQFDALFLTVRGVGAIKHKHAKEAVGLEAALIQEDIFSLIGIPLNQSYLKAKDQLLDDLQKRKNNSPEKSHAALDMLYKQEILLLRAQYNIDQQIDNAVMQLAEDEGAYQRLKDNFSTHLSMNFIEENIDIKEKKAHESDAEFKTKKKLNAEFKKYHALRSNFENALKKIEREFERKTLEQYAPIDKELKKVEEKRKEAAIQAKKQHDDLMRYYPGAKARDLDAVGLEALTQTLQGKQQRFQNHPNEALKKEIDQLNIEIMVLNIIEKNRDQLGTISKVERLDVVYDLAVSEIEAQKKSIEVECNEQKESLIAPLKPHLANLEKEKRYAIKQCHAEYKESIDKANQYHDRHILPLIKELKTQEAHKYFVVLSKKMSSFIQDSLSTQNNMDANSIAFIGLMGEYNTDLAILGGVHHVGMNVAEDIVSEAVATEDLEDEGVVQTLLESASQKVGAKIGKAIAKTEGSKHAFAQHVAFMEQHSHVRVPEIVADEFQSQTFAELYTPNKTASVEEEVPRSVFDFVQQFNQKQGVLGKASVAYDVYKALTAATPNMAFIEAPNMAQVFLKALEDEALSYSYQMLTEVKIAIDILENNHALDKMENKAEWLQLRSRVIALHESKVALDKEFQILCDSHVVLREKYIKAQEPFNEAKNKVEVLKERKQINLQRLQSLRQVRKHREPELYQQYLPAEKREDIVRQIDALEANKEKKLNSLNKKYKQEKLDISVQYDKNLKTANKKLLKTIKEYDENTQEATIDYIKKEYEKEKGFFSGLAANSNDLRQFTEAHPEVQKKITEYKQKRELGKAQFIQQHQINIDKLTTVKDSKISVLKEKKQIKSEDIEKESERQKLGIMRPFKEVEAKLAKIDEETSDLEKAIELQNTEISNQIEIIGQHEAKLIALSREFYDQVRSFNEHKAALHTSAQGVMNKFFSLNADTEPHLRAMQGMFKGAHMKTKALAKAAKHLPTLVDEASTYTMSYEDVTRKVLDAREVKAVSKTHEERETVEKIKDNVIQIGANSLIEAISGQSVKVVKNIVSSLDATLKAEAELATMQHVVDQRAVQKAKEMKVHLDSVPFVAPVVAPTQERPGFLSRLWHGIGDFFRRLKEAVVGKPEQQLAQQTVLNEAIVQDTVSLDLPHSQLNEKGVMPAAMLNGGTSRKSFVPHHVHVQTEEDSKRKTKKHHLPQKESDVPHKKPKRGTPSV
ncbi:hypothetical protein CC99x_012085 [Candidatus Berkiella cookevillensis]|uniref:Uncharacterized protein n=1 Tax=Candidatus Berkiella cookevillensis TaxID=437022 RepID=A0A0Q9YDW8_9GAMM|nr:hypothetical protein [Candidatus Berkiella cookevillensis]MCS5709635.1 hypothetical protein [Candidatus Berkiella cookevillensis]